MNWKHISEPFPPHQLQFLLQFKFIKAFHNF